MIVLYRPISEHASSTEQYIKEFHNLHPEVEIKTVDVDSEEGITAAGLYDIVEYPAIIAITDDGRMLDAWMGTLPLMNDVLSRVIAST